MEENGITISNNTSKLSNSINKALSQTMQNVWQNATKQELLEWIAANKNITADSIRNLFAGNNAIFTAALSFNTSDADIVVDFSPSGEIIEG